VRDRLEELGRVDWLGEMRADLELAAARRVGELPARGQQPSFE
jgi:hypothetical protein